MPKKLDRYEFIWKAIQKHGYKYNYIKTDYINSQTKVCIICPEHGEFWQTPNDHLNGCGCKKCGLYSIKKLSYTTNSFIEKAKKIHGDKYNYSKLTYNGCEVKVCIICKKHGEFYQDPYTHLKGHGCNKCGHIEVTIKQTNDTEQFIKKAKEIHGNKYDYSKVDYKHNQKKVCIICPEHGEFWQRADNHIHGSNFPICNESKLEIATKNILEENNINYIYQKKFKWLRNKNPMSLDFYLPDYNIGIECQGEQHYKSVLVFGGKDKFNETIKRDKLKLKLCQDNNVNLIYYTKPELKQTNEFVNTEELLTYLKKIKK